MKSIHYNTGWARWAARIICMAFAVFICIFAMDVFSEGFGFWKTLLALSIHLTPTFVILLILLLSWKHEWIGAIIYSILGIAYIIAGWEKSHWSAFVLIAGPLLLVGLLFMIAWHNKKQLRI